MICLKTGTTVFAAPIMPILPVIMLALGPTPALAQRAGETGTEDRRTSDITVEELIGRVHFHKGKTYISATDLAKAIGGTLKPHEVRGTYEIKPGVGGKIRVNPNGVSPLGKAQSDAQRVPPPPSSVPRGLEPGPRRDDPTSNEKSLRIGEWIISKAIIIKSNSIFVPLPDVASAMGCKAIRRGSKWTLEPSGASITSSILEQAATADQAASQDLVVGAVPVAPLKPFTLDVKGGGAYCGSSYHLGAEAYPGALSLDDFGNRMVYFKVNGELVGSSQLEKTAGQTKAHTMMQVHAATQNLQPGQYPIEGWVPVKKTESAEPMRDYATLTVMEHSKPLNIVTPPGVLYTGPWKVQAESNVFTVGQQLNVVAKYGFVAFDGVEEIKPSGLLSCTLNDSIVALVPMDSDGEVTCGVPLDPEDLERLAYPVLSQDPNGPEGPAAAKLVHTYRGHIEFMYQGDGCYSPAAQDFYFTACPPGATLDDCPYAGCNRKACIEENWWD